MIDVRQFVREDETDVLAAPACPLCDGTIDPVDEVRLDGIPYHRECLCEEYTGARLLGEILGAEYFKDDTTGVCPWCQEKVEVGENVWMLCGQPFHPDCLDDMGPEEILDALGY